MGNQEKTGLIAMDLVTKVPLYALLILGIFFTIFLGIYQFVDHVLKPLSQDVKEKRIENSSFK